LQQHWLFLAPRYPNIEDIQVIGIDLTKRGAEVPKPKKESSPRKKKASTGTLSE
jgi:hypothetical protein